MKVLVACEESQRVCIAFREKGYDAYSCDIQECSGGRPKWHILGDVLPILNGNTKIVTPPERIKFDSGKTMPAWYAELWHLPKEERERERSKTFIGIARAMAEQWG
jgi:hypothetical protein